MKICHCSLEGTACLTCNNNFTFTGGWGPRVGLCWQEDNLQKTLDRVRANKQREDKKMSKLVIVDSAKETKTVFFGDLEVGETFMFVVDYVWCGNNELLIKIREDMLFDLDNCLVHSSVDEGNEVTRKECELVIKH